ncbi:MAG: protease modulator HflC [Planctomycetota bacterium]
MKRRGILSILVAIVLVVTLITFLVAFQVRVGEQALVLRFGEVVRSVSEPGLEFKWPYPVETVERYDKRLRVLEGKYQEVYTDDGYNLVVQVAIGWSIDDAKTFYDRLQTAGRARRQLEGLVGSEANSIIGRHRFDQMISTDRERLAFDTIETEIRSSVADAVEERYGVRMHFVRITQLGLPQDVTEDVFERMKAERQRIATKFRSEGQEQADRIKTDADRQAELILTKAKAEATRTRAKGDAAAAEAYKVFKQHQRLAVFLKQLDSIRQAKDRLTVILDTRNPLFEPLKGDVDEVIRRHRGSEAAHGAGGEEGQ